MRKDCLQQALDMFDSYFTMMEENDVFVPLTKDYTPDGDKIATVLTVEGGESLNAAISNVRLFHRLGVRAMTLTWNYSNELASPAMRRANKGLTGRGREVVREMNRTGIAAGRIPPERRRHRRGAGDISASHICLAFKCPRSIRP